MGYIRGGNLTNACRRMASSLLPPATAEAYGCASNEYLMPSSET